MAPKDVQHDPKRTTIRGLRQRAEELLRKTPAEAAVLPTEDIQTLVHELQMYQTELELQNDELHKTQVELQDKRDRYVHLYDSAPVGYLTLDRKTHIEEANLTAATLLKIERRELIGQPLARFFDAEQSADALHLHVRETFASGSKQCCELPLTASDGSTLRAQLESCVALNDDLARCHTMLSDITHRQRAEEQLIGFGRILDESQNEIYIFDAESFRFLLVNQGARDNLGYTMAELQGLTPLHLKPEFTADAFAELLRPLQTGERSAIEFATTHRRKDGTDYPVEVHLQPSVFQGSAAYVAVILDISRRVWTESQLAGQKQTLELLASGAALELVLQTLVEVVETTSPGTIGSVLIVDPETRCFADGYAPNLPDFYNEAILGLAIGVGVGSCGTAAETGQRVVVKDVMTHDYWVNYRDLAEKAGLRACWSEPIISTAGEVLGCFAMYYREPRGPEDRDIKLIRTTAHIASLAIEQKQNEESIRKAHDSLDRRVQERTAELKIANQRLEAAMKDLEAEEQLLRRLINLQEEDRRMAAHDVHDGFLQYVQAAHMHLQTINSSANSDVSESTTDHVGSLLRKAASEGRRMIRNLRPIILDDEGIVEAIRYLIADSEDLIISYAHSVQVDRFDPKLEAAIFRVVQESLNNVKKHGQTDHADVQLKQNKGMLDIVIQDRGVGFDPTDVPPHRFGLRGIRERARLFGGAARIESTPGEGTVIRVQFPVQLST